MFWWKELHDIAQVRKGQRKSSKTQVGEVEAAWQEKARIILCLLVKYNFGGNLKTPKVFK